MFLSRRQFLKVSAGTVAAAAIADKALALTALQPVIEVGNPLGEYPDRSWERVYHDQYRYDSSFTWCCSPNDTHGCRIRAFVRTASSCGWSRITITRRMKICMATAARSRIIHGCA